MALGHAPYGDNAGARLHSSSNSSPPPFFFPFFHRLISAISRYSLSQRGFPRIFFPHAVSWGFPLDIGCCGVWAPMEY